MQIEKIEALEWVTNEFDCDWSDRSIRGYTQGQCWYYGGRSSGNLPYPILKRKDGLVAFPPANPDNPFSDSVWIDEVFGQ
jgi:hypothetical protein